MFKFLKFNENNTVANVYKFQNGRQYGGKWDGKSQSKQNPTKYYTEMTLI